MSAVAEVEASLESLPLLLTVEEAADVLRIGRTLAYELTRRYEASAGTDGVPVVRIGGCLRVPTWALAELISTGRVVCLVPGSVDEPATRDGQDALPANAHTTEPNRECSMDEPRPHTTRHTHRDDGVQLTLVDQD